MGGGGTGTPPAPSTVRVESSVAGRVSCTPPPSRPLPERVRITWHSAPGAVAESSGHLGFGGDPPPRRFSGAAKRSQPHSRADPEGARSRGREAPESFRHLPASTLPAARAEGTRLLDPNLGGRPRAPSRRAVRQVPGGPRPPPPRTRRNFAPSPAPPLRALTSRQRCRGAPQKQGEEQRGPAESRGWRPGRGHRGCGGRGAAGCAQADGAGACEPEAASAQGRRREAGVRGPGQPPEPPGRTRAQPRGRSGRAAPGAGGRVRRSRRASERGASGRREGAGAESVPSECEEGGRGRAGSRERGRRRTPGPASTSSRRPVGPAKFKANSPGVLWAEPFLPADARGSPALARRGQRAS